MADTRVNVGDVSSEYQAAQAFQEKPLGDAFTNGSSGENDDDSAKDDEEKAARSNDDSSAKDNEEQAAETKDVDAFQKQPFSVVAMLTATSIMAMFLVALDRTIIVTAIPDITNDFHSLPDIGWYASAYLMTCGVFQLFFGKIYSMYSVKLALLVSIALFEIGSAICGAAPTSTAFIVGRAIAGVGAAGILAGSVVTVTRIIPIEKQPGMNGLLGVTFGIAIILGPLIGGGFTSNVSWRWCFYLNLPIGGVVIAVRAFTIKVPNSKTVSLPWKQKIWHLDPFGAVCLVPAIVCLVLAMQWGGQAYPWSNYRVIITLTVMAVLFVAFVAVEFFMPKTALTPPRLFRNRSVIAALWQMFFVGAGMYCIVYYLPLWFQSIKGDSPISAGIKLFPTMLAMLVASIIFGIVCDKIGYYTPLGIIGSAIMAVGAGLLMLLKPDSGHAAWIGYQVVFGFGMGLSMQVPTLAIQTCLRKKDVPIGLGMTFFAQLVGGSIGVPIATNIFNSQLIRHLSGVPGFKPSLVTAGGASGIIAALPAAAKEKVLIGYNDAIRDALQVGTILCALAFLGSCGLEWVSTKNSTDSEKTEQRQQPDEEEEPGTVEVENTMF